MKSNIFIVLATFNGAAYLQVQLESLINQSESKWTLLIRDDGSTDDTLSIVRTYEKQDARIQLLDGSNTPSGSALENFSVLLEEACARDADYVFCCDQDDVWLPDKLTIMLKKLRQIEGTEKTPSLVHHDLVVVDRSFKTIADSFFAMMQLAPRDQHDPQRFITRNEVTGCAMACNRSLLEIALPISGHAVMHDWWLALCAAYFGRIAVLPEKLVQYRQHGGNTIGAKSFWHGLNPFTNWIAGWRRGNVEFVSTVKQADAFLAAMSQRLKDNPTSLTGLKQYAGILGATRFERLRHLSQFNLWRSHWLLNGVLILRMLLLPRTTEQ